MIGIIALICIIVLLVIVGSILDIASFARSKDYEISKAKLESKISRLERMIEDIRASVKAMDFGKAMDSRGFADSAERDFSSLPKEADALLKEADALLKEADALRGFVADKTNAPASSSLREGEADEAIHSSAQATSATNGLPRHASVARNDSTESAPRATNAESAPRHASAESSASALGFDAHAEFAQRKVFAKTQIPESKISESKTQNPKTIESKIQKSSKLESGKLESSKSESRLDSSSLNYDKARDADSSSRAKSARSFERIFTQKGMVFIAGIFFIFAAFFLIRYSIENALLTPQVRIALSMIFGALLLCFGFFCDAFGRYVKSPAPSQSGIFARIGKRFGISHATLESTQSATTQNTATQNISTAQSIDSQNAAQSTSTTRAKPSLFASFLPSIQALSTITQTCIGAGLVVIFFSFYGGFKLYGFFGAFGVFAGLSLSALLALVLSLRFGLVVGIFGLLGAFCTPILLASNTYNALSLFAYLAMFYAVVAYLAYRGGYVALLYLASAFVLLYALDFGIHREIDAPSFLVVAFMVALVICAHLLVFASPVLWLASQNVESKNADSKNVDSVDSSAPHLARAESSGQSTIQARQKAPRTASFTSALSFLVLGALLLQAKELGFQSLEYSFLALLCVILLALPFLRNFARFAIDERVLTLPMIFAMLSATCVFFVERASEAIVGAFMLLFALGIALHIAKNLRAKSRQIESDKADTADTTNKSNTANTAGKPKSRASQTHEVWYLWVAWLCGVAFGFLAVAMPLLRGFDVVDLTSPFGGYFNATKSFAIIIFVGVYAICSRYKIALRNDSLLLLCAIGALFVPASMYFGDILEAKRFIYARAAAWWMLGGAVLLVLGRTRFAPRDIAGFCFVFMAMGAIVFVRNAPLLENMLDALASSTLLDSGDVISLMVYFVVCVVNLAIFARFLSGVKISAKAKNSAESKAKRNNFGVFGNSGNLDNFSDLAEPQTFSAGAHQTLRVFFTAHLIFGILFFAWLMLYFCIWFFTALGLHGNSDVLALSLHGALLALCALGVWKAKSRAHALLALFAAFSAFLMVYAAFDMMRVLLIFAGYILIDTPSRSAAMLVYSAPLMMIVVCVASFLLKLDIARGAESIRLAFANKPGTLESKGPESKGAKSKRLDSANLDFGKIDSNIAESTLAKLDTPKSTLSSQQARNFGTLDFSIAESAPKSSATTTPESAPAESTAPKSSTLDSLSSFIQPAKLLRIFRASEIALDAMIFVLSVFVVVFAMRLLFVDTADLTLPNRSSFWWFEHFGSGPVEIESYMYKLFGGSGGTGIGEVGIGEIEGYAYSLILALLGVACLVAFLRFGVRSFRIYSLILLLLAALKVFFIDTSSFGGLAKIALFIIMGALFLAISLVYSKYVFKKDQF
ncbi:hypothetical protein BKN38_05860 [Helicobacter sp. CLO-3]|uniref:DUF2339 domain-containing protein n=1 Tax=unclassified Helicobacter TaxID=2593540 RepID=UPI0008D9CCDA|nr:MULTISPECIES: DUF2339 domain-containing protein [unclassified Helicobacter]OHU83062.1 hypothetical protein BKN38_05860 [Helicobacter sp. CLO-3]